MSEVLIDMEGIEKSFPGVRALDQCRFELRAGEVHALLGENGAGKSTMMKVLAGIYAPDAGHIRYRGKEVTISSPKAAQQLGISTVSYTHLDVYKRQAYMCVGGVPIPDENHAVNTFNLKCVLISRNQNAYLIE